MRAHGRRGRRRPLAPGVGGLALEPGREPLDEAEVRFDRAAGPEPRCVARRERLFHARVERVRLAGASRAVQRVGEQVRRGLALAHVRRGRAEQRFQSRDRGFERAAVDFDACERERRDHVAGLEPQRLGRERVGTLVPAGARLEEREVGTRRRVGRRERGRALERGARLLRAPGPGLRRAERVPGVG